MRRRSRSRSIDLQRPVKQERTDRSDRNDRTDRSDRNDRTHRDRDNHHKSDIDHLTGSLSNQIQLMPEPLNEKILPEFNPESKDLTAARWVSEVNHCAESNHWTDFQTLYFATLRLRGCARGWLEQISASDSPFMSWSELSNAIGKKFPFSKSYNFGQTLEEVVNFTCDFSCMSLMSYHFDKLNRINRLNLGLSEERIFELVVHGICDVDLRVKALLFCKNKSLAELDEFVGMFADEEMRRKNELREVEGSKRNGRNFTGKIFRKPERGNTCFNCGEVGHKKRMCPGMRRGNSPQD